jgi:hypothetical protein
MNLKPFFVTCSSDTWNFTIEYFKIVHIFAPKKQQDWSKYRHTILSTPRTTVCRCGENMNTGPVASNCRNIQHEVPGSGKIFRPCFQKSRPVKSSRTDTAWLDKGEEKKLRNLTLKIPHSTRMSSPVGHDLDQGFFSNQALNYSS